MLGAMKGHAQVVEMLLAADANTDLQRNVWDSTTTPPVSLSKPATQEDDGSYKALCSYPSLLSPQQKGMTALNLSALKGHDQCLNLLIKAGARLDLKSKRGRTALANAKDKNHPKCVALLEAANAP